MIYEGYGDHRGRIGHALFFLFSYYRFDESGYFLALNLPYPKGNHPSKFQLAEVRRFGGVWEHPNRLTH